VKGCQLGQQVVRGMLADGHRVPVLDRVPISGQSGLLAMAVTSSVALPKVMITDHVAPVRVPSDHAGRRVAAA
jgi:hypothetical protein